MFRLLKRGAGSAAFALNSINFGHFNLGSFLGNCLIFRAFIPGGEDID